VMHWAAWGKSDPGSAATREPELAAEATPLVAIQ